MCRGVTPVSAYYIAPDISLADLTGVKVLWSQLTDLKELTKGGFSVVYSALLNGEQVAVKRFNTPVGMDEKDNFTQQLGLLSSEAYLMR